MKVISAFSLTVIAFLLGSGPAAQAADAFKAKTPWEITGQLEEACSCDAPCPCWFNSKPSRMTCDGGQVLFIQKGNYGKVKLDGLAIARMGQSPAGQSMMNSFGNWNFSYTYIDERATPEQRKAMEAIAKIMDPGASKKTEIRYAPITRKIEGKEHEITLGRFGSFRGHLIEGGLGGTAPKIINPPGADPVHREYLQGRTSKLTYTDADQNWSYQNTNYMFGTFTVDNIQYERYAAGLAQEMEPPKKENASRKK